MIPLPGVEVPTLGILSLSNYPLPGQEGGQGDGRGHRSWQSQIEENETFAQSFPLR